MIRRAILSAVAALLVAVPATGQEKPKAPRPAQPKMAPVAPRQLDIEGLDIAPLLADARELLSDLPLALEADFDIDLGPDFELETLGAFPALEEFEALARLQEPPTPPEPPSPPRPSAAPRPPRSRDRLARALAEAGKNLAEAGRILRRYREETLYNRGTRELNEGRWENAVAAFTAVAQRGERRAPGALYWKAYAENKLGEREAAQSTLDELRQTFPQSRWLNEAKALAAEISRSSGQPVSPENVSDDEIKLLAINSLMNSAPERAIPLLEKVLQGSNSPRLKERALFVLAQSGSPAAREILARTARGQANPDLQLKAVRYLGVHGGGENRQILAEIYSSVEDADVRRSVLRSFMIAGDRDNLLKVAQEEPDAELRARAVRELGVMGAAEELWQLYQRESSTDVKKSILKALFVGGADARLIEVARTEQDPELRREAVHRLGLMGSERTAPALVEMYGSEKDIGVRQEVLKSFFLQGNAKALLDVARAEPDSALRREAVHRLGLVDTADSSAGLAAIYRSDKDRDVRREVLKSFFLQGNAKALIEIARSESDPELKKEAFKRLSLIDSKEARDFLLEILEQ